jgi:P4 family phage/plasmid primase-like protien
LGARLGTHYGTSVIALPIHDATNQIIGYAAASSTGGKMLIEHKGTDGQVQHSEQTSWKNVFPRGSAGIIATPNLLNAETRAGLTRIYKTEGPSDLLALIPLLQPGEGAFCNPSGAGENPEKFSWMLDWFDGKQVVVIHDRDNAGVAGALGDAAKGKPGFAGWAARTAEEVRNVELPYPLVEKNGRDLRDWIIEGGDLFGIQNLISDAPIINAVGIAVIEDGADPHYLARINLKNYEERHGRRLVFWKSEWYRWKSGCYVRIDDTELRSKVTLAVRNEFVIQWQDDLQRYREWQKSDKFDESRDKGPPKVKKVTPQLVGAVISAMASLTQLPGTTPMPCWLPDRSKRHYVSMKNGILDFDKVFAGRDIDEFLLPHSPNWFSQFQLQYKFDWDSKCPMWLEYLHYSMEGDQERVDLLQEWAGYLLTTTNYLQRFLVLEGKGGNGKTVYFAAMRAMLGNENVSSVALEKFGGRFDLATTLGRAANISGDVGEIDSVCEGTLKQFTGGDAMTFDRKNKEPLEAIPTAKLMMAWNLRPRFKDRSSGVWRRMLLVPFEREVPQEKRIAGMDSYEWWLASGEVPAILRWAIEGLDRLQTIGRFTHSKVSEDAIKNYRQESNPANDFLVEHCCETGDPRDRIEVQWLYDLYCLWCKNSGHTYPLAQNQLGKEVKRAFPSSDKKRFTFLGNREASEKDRDRAYFYTGIAFTVEKIAGKSTDSTIRD